MSLTAKALVPWINTLLGANPIDAGMKLNDYLAAIPRLDALADLPAGTVVLVRGDVDAKPGKQIGEGDIRLRSMLDTLKFGQQHGWVQVVFGHIGRKPEGTLDAVAARLGELLNTQVPLVADWWDASAGQVAPAAAAQIAAAAPGSVLVLENTRRYDIERVLWKAKPDDVEKLAAPLTQFAQALADRIGTAYVNEALSAGSLDSSSTIVPAAMQRVALGKYVAQEFDGPMQRCLQARLVMFSGLKADKLDDLEAMIERGTVQVVFTGGSLAMALKKADAALAGHDFCLGLAEHPDHADKPYYIPPERIAQARRMLEAGRTKGIDFILPVDFVLQDGQPAETIGPNDQQFDVGPKSCEIFAQAVDRFIVESQNGGQPSVAFHNGVLGMFEDERFAAGTRHFMGQLKRLTDAGVEVYIGGGEGGAAMEKYGDPSWIKHCFTAGGTVLNALGAAPVPYLQALWMASRR